MGYLYAQRIKYGLRLYPLAVVAPFCLCKPPQFGLSEFLGGLQVNDWEHAWSDNITNKNFNSSFILINFWITLKAFKCTR